MAKRAFVPVEELRLRPEPAVAASGADEALPDLALPDVAMTALPPDAWESRTNLFGDAER